MSRMVRVSELIKELQETLDNFGDTCVYIRDMSWGAVALNREAADKEAAKRAPTDRPTEEQIQELLLWASPEYDGEIEAAMDCRAAVPALCHALLEAWESGRLSDEMRDGAVDTCVEMRDRADAAERRLSWAVEALERMRNRALSDESDPEWPPPCNNLFYSKCASEALARIREGAAPGKAEK